MPSLIESKIAVAEPVDGNNPKPSVPMPSLQVMKDYNKFVDWLDKEKKMKGHPDLDKNNLGPSYLAEYIKLNPGTSLNGSKDQVKSIQRGLSESMKYAYDQVKQGKAKMAPGTKAENILTNLSQEDGYVGKLTTSRKFPGAQWTLKDEAGNTIDVSGTLEEPTMVPPKGAKAEEVKFQKIEDIKKGGANVRQQGDTFIINTPGQKPSFNRGNSLLDMKQQLQQRQ